MAVFSALPPPARRQERHLADRLLELMHRGHRHREERRRKEAAEQCAVLVERALHNAVHEVDGEQRIRGLDEAHQQHLAAGIVYPDAATQRHDGADDPRQQHRSRVGRRQTRTAGDLIGGVDDDVMVVGGEEPLAEYCGEQAQQRRDDEDALQRAVYFSSPFCSICWYMRTYASAITRWVKCRSARSRHARGSSVVTFSPAVISSSSVSRSTPTAGVTISGRAPRRVPTTGVPENSASIVGSPNGSSHCAGIHRQRARARSTALRFPSTSPTYLTEPVKLGRQPPAMMSRRPVRFAASTAQWYPRSLCSLPRNRSHFSLRPRKMYSAGSRPL